MTRENMHEGTATLYSTEVWKHLHQRSGVGLRGRDPLSIRTNNISKSFIYLGSKALRLAVAS